MIINNVTKVQVINTILANNSANAVTVDCNNVHWVNNDASFAFADFPNLTTVSNIGNTVTNIGGMFYNCTSLVNAPTIPASVTNTIGVGGTVTYYAWSLQSPISDPENPKQRIYRVYTLVEDLSEYVGTWDEVPCYTLDPISEEFVEFDSIFIENQTDLDAYYVEFWNSAASTTITRQGAYDQDAPGASAVGLFEQCKSLVSAPVFGAANTSLDQCFRNCSSLVNVPSLPNATSMVNTFTDCYNLVNVTDIPNSVTNMVSTFEYCTNLVTAPNIPNSVTNMTYTFASCTNLTTVPTLPNSISTLEYTFVSCYNLTNVTIPNSVTNLYGTFASCSALTNIVLPNSVSDMTSTFTSCGNLANVSALPNTVIQMVNTFIGCTSLTTAPVLPNSVVNAFQTFARCNNLDLPAEYTLANTSITYAGYMFYNCTNLTNAPALPGSVTRIDGLFSGCTNITTAPNIPAAVTNMWHTFLGCTNLAGDIFIESENVATATGCFTNTSAVKNVYIPFQNNGVNTKTYNAFTTAGYSASTRLDGVLLFNIANYTPAPIAHTINTDGFVYTVDANDVVILTGLDMADKTTVTLPNIE